ncbi:DUF6089 family protein [Roseivirga sp. UBA1976]|uniref:type IX secretion system protein PorG n=1 Tax=Roseivirga sp. UBA1976 TaxID=1947386 RepID=UPI00257A920B|nr:DUF6089 family protein [Roseivirga sp. UBA1976]
MSSLQPYRTDNLSIERYLFIIAFFIIPFAAKAQLSEIGLEVGTNNYLGDVVRKYDFSNGSLGGQFFIRKHLNEGVSYRISAGIGQLKGADDEAFDVFSANRRASFEGSFFLTDLLIEYHFLNYRNEKLQQFWTPYLFFGAGLYRMEGQDNFLNNYDTGINLRIPVGVGVKLRLDRRWVLGIATSAISTGSDMLDNVSEATPNIKDYRGGNPNDNDWMFNTSISLSYTFYKIVCWKPFF